MTDRVVNSGGAIPPGWSVSAALANERKITERFLSLQNDPFAETVLVGQENSMKPENWPVRDQGDRGTCNAFAIAAAEELVETNQFNKREDLSEEFLYAHLRKDIVAPLIAAGVAPGVIDEEDIAESGGTFLIRAPEIFAEHGICEEHFAKYDKNRRPENFSLDPIPAEAIADAGRRRRPEGTFRHGIARDPSVGDGRFWINEGEIFGLSRLFAEQLHKGLPVVASFAILSDTGGQAWDGKPARRFGLVEYPGDGAASLMEPVGGHTVCLLGMGRNIKGLEHPNYFLFRNSWGTDRFASRAAKDGLDNLEPAPGYGVISARDVDRYCWEYLTRKSGSDGLPQV